MLQLQKGFQGERSIVLSPAIVRTEEDDVLTSALHITDIGYYPTALFHYCRRPDPIRETVLIYCVEGKGWYQLDGTTYDIVPGCFFFLPAGRPHAYAADPEDPWTIYWIHFKGSLASVYTLEGTGPGLLRPETDSRHQERIRLFEEMYDILDSGVGMDHLRYASALLHTFLASLRFMPQWTGTGHPETGSDRISRAIRFMKEHLEQRLSLDDIAQAVGYSASHFSALFRQQTGQSPMAYFNMLKIQTACFLLDSTQLKINKIGLKIGFSDPYYFSRLFTSVMGVSPSHYRRFGR